MVFGIGTYVSCTSPPCPAHIQLGRFKSLRPPKNRAVIYSLGVAAVYTTPLQFNSCYHGMTPQHYITGATATLQHRNVNGIITGGSKASHGITHFF